MICGRLPNKFTLTSSVRRMAYLLKFVSGLLLDAVNTLYICYAMDKDQRRVTLPEVHNLFAQVRGR